MATWTRKTTLAVTNIINLVSSGTKFYYFGSGSQSHRPLVDVGPDIYEYDPAGNTETKIIDMGNVGFNGCGAIAWFKGDLYMINQEVDSVTFFPAAHIVIKTYKWTGSVDGVTLVDTMYDQNDNPWAGANVLRLYADSNYLMALALNGSTTYINLLRYSANGSVWSAGTLPFNVLGVNSSMRFGYGADFTQGIYEMLRDRDAGVWKAVVGASGNFNLHQASPPTGGLFYSDPASGGIHWSTFGGEYEFFDHNFTTRGPGDPNYEIQAYIQINLGQSTGMKPVSGHMELYTTNSGTWALLDTVSQAPNGPNFADPEVVWVVRTSDNEVYITGYNYTTAQFEVWQRSEPLVPPVVGSGRLWVYKTVDNGISWTSRGVVT